jgi:hypothetical protein
MVQNFILLFKIRMGTRKNLFNMYTQFRRAPLKSFVKPALRTSGLKWIRIVSNGRRMCGFWFLAVLSCWILSDHLWKANAPEGNLFYENGEIMNNKHTG